MSESGFSQIITSGCLYTDADAGPNGIRRSAQRRGIQMQQDMSLKSEPKEFPLYETASSGDVRRMLVDHGTYAKRFETTLTSIDGEWDVNRYDNYEADPRERDRRTGQHPKQETYEGNGYFHTRNPRMPAVRLKVAHQDPISIRPRNKNPQIVNVCQTFRFPDNFITQNNANRVAQHQEHMLQQQRPVPEPRRAPIQLLSPCHSTYRSRSRLGGFFGVYRRHRNMHSQTSRTLLELVESEQKLQLQSVGSTAVPRTVMNHSFGGHRMPEDSVLATSASETSIGEGTDIHPRVPPTERKAKMALAREPARTGIGRSSQVPYFDRTKRNRSCTKLVDGGATMGGHYGRSSRTPAVSNGGKSARYLAKPKADHRRSLGEDALECPFVDDPFASMTSRNRNRPFMAEDADSIDDNEGLDDEEDVSDVDPLDEQDNDREDLNESNDLEVDEEEEQDDEVQMGDAFGHRRSHVAATGDARSASVKEGSIGISGIVDKLQDNVWEVCLEGIWDLMDMAGRIDWKLQEKYITVINRKLIEFLKSPRTALCRSACQVSGELFRQAKSTKRPEFDEMVDILLCKTADPNRFIQKDANVALDKLVTYIPTPHTVRAISNRGTIHRNPLVRTATARLLVCVCVVSGLDAILGATANTRTRKTILSMLAKFLTDKNLETRKFGERLYRMLRKHKFFDEYFYKDMDNNLRTNLKRVLKGV
ncbi:uncharacterized protein LOC128721062 [Anopheles nili]|uniref:uncharacterized protein LOC128721062 n=1 Tax=Anopheles nili TaxID=185578 RepID=UPI00237B48EB|nr:uncharacterized protein LOC128721062 [Anopheles nili]